MLYEVITDLVAKLVSNDPLRSEVDIHLFGEVKSELVLPESIECMTASPMIGDSSYNFV